MKIIDKNGNVENLCAWNIPKNFVGPEMTCRQSEIDVSYKDIVKVFGKETLNGDGYKVQAEWHIFTPDGIATIYDYKEGKCYNGKDGISKTKVRDWHIGGDNLNVVQWILKAMKLQ